jgi:Transposase DDE domain
MRALLGSEHGQRRYRKRKQTVEPLFGNTKHKSGIYRFHRRGRIKVRLEWRLLMMTHNLTKLHRTNSPPWRPETGPPAATASHTAGTTPTALPPAPPTTIGPRVCATASTRSSCAASESCLSTKPALRSDPPSRTDAAARGGLAPAPPDEEQAPASALPAPAPLLQPSEREESGNSAARLSTRSVADRCARGLSRARATTRRRLHLCANANS